MVAPAMLNNTFTSVGTAVAAPLTVPAARVKLTVPGIAPDDGDGNSAVAGTPAVDTVTVKLPEPESETVPVCPQPTAIVVGDTAKVGGVGGGGASPAGPAVPITAADSTTRFCASVTMSELVPQPLCVTR